MNQPVHRPGHTRREFTQRMLAIAGAVGAAAYIRTAHAASYPKGKFVDVHTHIGQVWNQKLTLSRDGLLEWMDEHEVAQAVVLPLVSPESSSYLITNEYVLEQTKGHRDRLIPFCCLDPRTSYRGGVKGLIEMLKQFVDAGARGFGEHKTGVPIDDPQNMRVYEACTELKLPLLFHLDNIRNTDKPGLPGLEKALRAFADLTFIGHGPGWWASIDGNPPENLAGYPKDPVTPGGAIDRLMENYPNICGDLSAGSGANAISRDPDFGRKFLIRRADRLMFGTDYLMPNQQVKQFEVMESMNLPANVQQKIFRDNARRLINFS